LSAIVSNANTLPAAEGVQVTLIVQLAPAATLDPQLLVCAKSLELAPVSATLPMPKGAPPAFVRVTLLAVLVVPTDWLPKARLPAEKLAAGDPPMPVPTSAILGLKQPEVHVSETLPVSAPLALGAKVTSKTIDRRTPRVTGAVNPLTLKAEPLTATPETVTLADPEFVRATPRVLLAPTETLPKTRLSELTTSSPEPAAHFE